MPNSLQNSSQWLRRCLVKRLYGASGCVNWSQRMNRSSVGLTLCCLMALLACGCAQPLPEQRLITNGCPKVTRCELPATSPLTNRDLSANADDIDLAWAVCAAKVDTIVDCQSAIDSQ